jgi:hypothetical protein
MIPAEGGGGSFAFSAVLSRKSKKYLVHPVNPVKAFSIIPSFHYSNLPHPVFPLP